MKKTDYAHREALAAPKRKTNASRQGEADTCRIMHKMLECSLKRPHKSSKETDENKREEMPADFGQGRFFEAQTR